MQPDAGALIRDVRTRHRLSQETLARRAGTTQRQVSRIERGDNSPSVATVARLLAAMGERLELRASPGPRDNRSTRDLRDDVDRLSASERLAQSIDLSLTLTGIASRR